MPEVQKPTKPLLEDLHGMAEARSWGEQLAQDIADYRARRISWSAVDRGALLHGEPGTGKTIFATALAATCRVALIATSFADWQRSKEGHMGDVLSAMNETFKLARRHAPCILFIDEIEAVGSRRVGGNNERWYTGIITALNEHLDGTLAREGVVVIAASNYPDRIDPALLRPGRLDAQIAIPMPSAADLQGILRFHLKESLPKADLGALAVALVGSTGAHVEKIVRTAERRARRFPRELLLEDLFAALGERAIDLPRDLLERIAIHEAGHAVAAVVLRVSRKVGISLFSLGGSSARTFFDPQLEAVTREVVERRIAVALAGRAAEEVIFGNVSAGSGESEMSDLAVANNLAFTAVARWGLADVDELRWLRGSSPEEVMATHPELAKEAYRMIDGAYARALALIRRRVRHVRAIAAALMKRRALGHEEIVALLARPVPETVGAGTRKGSRRDALPKRKGGQIT